MRCNITFITGHVKMNCCRSRFRKENAARLLIEMWLPMNGTGKGDIVCGVLWVLFYSRVLMLFYVALQGRGQKSTPPSYLNERCILSTHNDAFSLNYF